MNVYIVTVDNYGYGDCRYLIVAGESVEKVWRYIIDTTYKIESKDDIRRIVNTSADVKDTVILYST